MNSGERAIDCRQLKQPEKGSCRRAQAKELKIEWLKRLTFSSDKYSAELVQLWMGIFAVDWRILPNPSWISRQIKTIESLQFSSYPNLLAGVLKNPAILQSLSAFKNDKDNPNENLGREVLELYSVGEGNYTEKDVQQVALALTGYRLNSD